MRVVDAAGSWEQIGFTHGRETAAGIEAHLHRWRTRLAPEVGDVDAWLAAFLDRTRFVETAEAATPWLVAEVGGIAEGARISSADAWMLQLLDETWMQGGVRWPVDHGAGCTSFAAVEGMRSWTGQTMDLEGFRDGAQQVLRLRPEDRHDQLVVTMAGCVGLLGVSAAGFVVCVNALPQVPAHDTGLPVSFVVRAALAAPDLHSAVAVVRDAPHATGQHYVVASEHNAVSLECSPVGVVEVRPQSKRHWHTNHPLVGYLTTDDDAESDARWEAARQVMTLTGFGLRRGRELLEASPIRRPQAGPMDTSTFAAALVEQSASRPPELSVTVGPPAPGTWTTISWS